MCPDRDRLRQCGRGGMKARFASEIFLGWSEGSAKQQMSADVEGAARMRKAREGVGSRTGAYGARGGDQNRAEERGTAGVRRVQSRIAMPPSCRLCPRAHNVSALFFPLPPSPNPRPRFPLSRPSFLCLPAGRRSFGIITSCGPLVIFQHHGRKLVPP